MKKWTALHGDPGLMYDASLLRDTENTEKSSKKKKKLCSTSTTVNHHSDTAFKWLGVESSDYSHCSLLKFIEIYSFGFFQGRRNHATSIDQAEIWQEQAEKSNLKNLIKSKDYHRTYVKMTTDSFSGPMLDCGFLW